MKTGNIVSLFVATFKHWNRDKVSHLAAALSYYTVFSLAPVLVIFITILSFIFGHDVISSHVINQISNTLGESSALEIQRLVESISRPSKNFLPNTLSAIILAWGIVGLFSELQNCFNIIWQVEPPPGRSWIEILKSRFFSFTIVLGICFLLLVSLLFSALLASINDHLHRFMPTIATLWLLLDFFISTAGITLLFAAIFKIVPDITLQWRDVFWGAFVTSLLFTLGKFFLSVYLAKSNIATSYGAAASLVVILVWVYYSAQILLYGAEFTKIYTYQYGSKKLKANNRY